MTFNRYTKRNMAEASLRCKELFCEAPREKIPVRKVMDILHVKFPALSQKALGIALRQAFPNIKRIRPGSRKRRNVNHYYGIMVNQAHPQVKKKSLQAKIIHQKNYDDPRRRRQFGSSGYKLSPHHRITTALLTVDDEEIGRGTFGRCYKGKYRGMDVVVKNFTSFGDKERRVIKNAVEREASIMLQLPPHRNLPFLFGIQNDEVPFSLVTQLYSVNGVPLTIHGAFKETSYALSLNISWNKVAYMCAEGLRAIHQAGILHNDIKDNNVVLYSENGTYTPVIIDFGKACATSQAKGLKLSKEAQIRWKARYRHIAPELVDGTDVESVATDTYSFGYLIYCINMNLKKPSKLLSNVHLMCIEKPATRASLSLVLAVLCGKVNV